MPWAAPALDANNFWHFVPSDATAPSGHVTQIIYVSKETAANDSNNGLTVGAPKRTINAAVTALLALGNGVPNWLLCRKGDDFKDDSFCFLSSGGNFTGYGYSKQEPMILGSYDPSQPGVVNPVSAAARPRLRCSTGYAYAPAGTTSLTQGGENVVLDGFAFENYIQDANVPEFFGAPQAATISNGGGVNDAIITLTPGSWQVDSITSPNGTPVNFRTTGALPAPLRCINTTCTTNMSSEGQPNYTFTNIPSTAAMVVGDTLYHPYGGAGPIGSIDSPTQVTGTDENYKTFRGADNVPITVTPTYFLYPTATPGQFKIATSGTAPIFIKTTSAGSGTHSIQLHYNYNQVSQPGTTTPGRYTYMMFHDCDFGHFANNCEPAQPGENKPSLFNGELVFYRCIMHDSWDGNSFDPQGNAKTTLYQTMFDHGGWSELIPTSPNKFVRNIYSHPSHMSSATLDQTIYATECIFANDGDMLQFRQGADVINSLIFNTGAIYTALPFARQYTFDKNVFIEQSLHTFATYAMFCTGGPGNDATNALNAGTFVCTNNILAHAMLRNGGFASHQDDSTKNYNYGSSNILLNHGRWTSNGSQMFSMPGPGFYSGTITNPGAGITIIALPCSSVQGVTTGPFAHVNELQCNFATDPTQPPYNAEPFMHVKFVGVGSSAADGYYAIDYSPTSSSFILHGSNFPAGLTGGTVYFGYQHRSLTGGSVSGAVQTIMMGPSGPEAIRCRWHQPNTPDLPGDSYTLGATITTASPLPGQTSPIQIHVDGLTGGTFSSANCNPQGINGNLLYPDPLRTTGSYYATLPGATANKTFTGSIVNGVLTVTGTNSPDIEMGDALVWSGQTKAEYIWYQNSGVQGGNGSYSLGSINFSGGIYPLNVSSRSMQTFSRRQLTALMRQQSKSNWNAGLTAPIVNNYIRAGFGITSGISLSPTLPNGTVGMLYDFTIAASGGVSPYTFSITSGALPTGLTLNTSTGRITGTPTVANPFSFIIHCVDSTSPTALTVDQSYTITVSAPSSGITLTAIATTGTVGTPYNQTIIASGGTSPYTFSFTGTLPPGLSLNSSGVVSGTPTTAGSFNFTVTATDASSATGSNGYSIVISGAAAGSIVVDFRVNDFGLNVLASEPDRVFICSQEPTTYTEAVTTFALGSKIYGARGTVFSSVGPGSPSGRKVSFNAITDGAVNTSGTASHWAAVDSTTSRLLARGPFDAAKSVTAGAPFAVSAFNFTLH